MIIGKKPPRPHAPGEPLLYPDHPLPRTRREFLAAGMISGGSMIIGPAWLGALLKARGANAGTGQVALSNDINALTVNNQCNAQRAAGSIPVVCFDLSGGANLVGSEVLVGVQGGQSNFLSTAGYGRLGVPGNMVPSSSANIDPSLGLLWHADGAIKRGILSKATTPATTAGTNGAVFCAESQNDTQQNPHNPMYALALAGAQGQLMTLCGTDSSVSGGNSMAPMMYINPALQPTTIDRPSDATALVSTGGANADPLSVAVQESQARISGGTAVWDGSTNAAFSGALSAPSGSTPGVQILPNAPYVAGGPTDGTIKNQVRCAYVQSAYTTAVFGNPSALDPIQDQLITGGATPIFTQSDFQDNDVAATATVMKLVIDGYAGAGTINMGGFDYHDGTRATGETKNFKAGQMIGAVLEYAQRKGVPVMVYVFSDGSLTSTGMVDSSVAGRGKLGWQGDNQSVASTFFLVYNPGGRPTVRQGSNQQIGYFSSDGSVVSTSSPVGNNVTSLVQAVVLNYMGLLGTDATFASLFAANGGQGLGSGSQLSALTVFNPIV
jgi:hypothetical protein